MKLPLCIILFCMFSIVGSTQNTFIKEYTEGNFTVIPGMIETNPNGAIICGFKSKENPDRGYFFCDQYDLLGYKIGKDSLLYSDDFRLYLNDEDNRPTVINNKLFWFKDGFDFSYVLSISLLDASIEILDTIDFSEFEFWPSHMKYVSPGNYFFTGSTPHETTGGPISDLAVAKVSGQQIEVYVERKLDSNNNNDIGKRVLSIRNDSIKVLSNLSRGALWRGFQISSFDADLNKIDSIKTDFIQPKIGTIFDGIEDSEGNYAFVSWSNDFKNNISFMSKDGSIIWHKEIGHNLNAEHLSKIRAIIESQEKDGYIFAGSDMTFDIEQDSIFSYAVVGKISKAGEMQWYRKYKTIDSTRASHEFKDVALSPDGGYFLVGTSFSRDDEDPEPQKLLLAKVDDQGLIDGYTNVKEINKAEEKIFFSYPNPFVNQLIINHKLSKARKYKLIDAKGQEMISWMMKDEGEEKTIKTENYNPGLYFIKVFNSSNEFIGVEKVIKID